MIEFVAGNLFDSKAEAIVNTVNCVGVMGRGIALQFKASYPDNFKAYAAACMRGEVVPGKMFVFKTNRLANPKYIINFPTKRHWRAASRLEDIEAGLDELARVAVDLNIASLALPPLGTGLGGLEWDLVKDRIENGLKGLAGIDIEVFAPNDLAEVEQGAKPRPVPKMTTGRAALVCLVRRYLGALLDPYVTLLEIHKLMYFLQESGETLRLDFVKGYYGPYAKNLSHVLRQVEGNLLEGYDGKDDPSKEIALVPGAEVDAEALLAQSQETSARMDRLAKLVEGFESSFGMELLATVHWVARHGAKTLAEIIADTHGWGQRKTRFSQRHIAIAANRLADQGWIMLDAPH